MSSKPLKSVFVGVFAPTIAYSIELSAKRKLILSFGTEDKQVHESNLSCNAKEIKTICRRRTKIDINIFMIASHQS